MRSDADHACLLLQSAESTAMLLADLPRYAIDQRWLARVINDLQALQTTSEKDAA